MSTGPLVRTPPAAGVRAPSVTVALSVPPVTFVMDTAAGLLPFTVMVPVVCAALVAAIAAILSTAMMILLYILFSFLRDMSYERHELRTVERPLQGPLNIRSVIVPENVAGVKYCRRTATLKVTVR